MIATALCGLLGYPSINLAGTWLSVRLSAQTLPSGGCSVAADLRVSGGGAA